MSDGEKYDELAYAVGKLLAAIRNVHQSKEYQHVWQLYSAHQFTYRGPDYARELSNVIDVLWKHRRGLDGTHS